MGQFEVDGSAGEHDEAEGGVGGVEPVGAAHDEPDPVVEAFDAAVGQPEAEGVDDVFAAPADGAGELDERGESAALGPCASPVEQLFGGGGVEVVVEDGPERFFEGVGPPHRAAVAAYRVECHGLAVGEVFGFLTSAHRAPLNFLARSASTWRSSCHRGRRT